MTEAEIGQLFEEESESGFPVKTSLKTPGQDPHQTFVDPCKPTLKPMVASNLLNFIA